MNKRFLIYGIVVLVLGVLLMEDDADNPYSLKVSVQSSESLKTLCLEEIAGFESGMLGKMMFCDCVSSSYSINATSAEKFMKAFEETVQAHWIGLRDTRTKARNIAKTGGAPSEFDSQDPALNVLLRRFNLDHPIDKLKPKWEQLAKASGKFWDRAMYTCSQAKPKTN